MFSFFLADCQPTFFSKPGNDGKLYVLNGQNSVTLTWTYSTSGNTILWVDFQYAEGQSDRLVARKQPPLNNGVLQIPRNNGYNNRVTYTGSTGTASFEVKNIVPSDSRIFECKVTFTSVDDPWIESAVELIVAGKCYT